jgi:hypothetical protein
MTHRPLAPAAFLAVAITLNIPVAALAQAPSDGEAIKLCVETREKIFECKEQFAEAFVNHHRPPAAERAAMKAKALEEIIADGSGPLGPRRQVCADMAAQGKRPPADKLQELKKGLAECTAKASCDARAACLMPLIRPMVGKGQSVKR